MSELFTLVGGPNYFSGQIMAYLHTHKKGDYVAVQEIILHTLVPQSIVFDVLEDLEKRNLIEITSPDLTMWVNLV